MARLANRNAAIPCGYVYIQAQTGHKLVGNDFDSLVNQVVRHRKANPQHNLETEWGIVADEVEKYLVAVLQSNPRWNKPRFLAFGAASQKAYPNRLSPQQFFQKAGNVVGVVKAQIKNTRAGIGLYKDWFGHGGMPVEKAEATRRAEICLRCPMLVEGNYMQRWNRAAAYEIMTILGVIKDLDLNTIHDAALKKRGICDACDCPMEAKIWSPLDTIKKHIRPEASQSLWAQCWITDHAGRRSSIEE